MDDDAINRKRLTILFEAMDEAVSLSSNEPAQQLLCIFGGAAVIAYGSTLRQTQDIDVWRPASEINDRTLRKMAEAAGLAYNPTDLEPETIYLQLVDQGVVRLPDYDKTALTWSTGQRNEVFWRGDHLTVVAAPPAIVAAAKLVRGDPEDIEDVIFIMNAKGIRHRDIAAAISHFPADAAARARENMVLLGYADDGRPRVAEKAHKPRGRGDGEGIGE